MKIKYSKIKSSQTTSMEESRLKELIQQANKQFFLRSGGKSYSPIIQVSSFLALKYISQIKKPEDNQQLPFFFSFPDKKSASIWLSICLLTNFFNEDYIESEGRAVTDLKKTRKYSVYGSIGKYMGQISDKKESKFQFIFADGTIYCKTSIRDKIKNVPQSRMLNKVSHYIKRKKKAKQNRTPLSKILEPSEGVIINDQVFTSKILLIAGRGNTKSINKLLDAHEILDESIREVYSPNDNIILKPDLKDFKSFFDQNYLKKVKYFLEWVDRLIDAPKIDKNILNFLTEIKASIAEKEETITSEIDAQFTDFVEEYSDAEPRLRKLIDDYYPGITTELPVDLKAVIINDINQIEEYPVTIKGFLQNKIPVIFTSNRMIEKSTDLSFYNRLFNPQSGNWKDAYRINWNRSKVNTLIKITDPDEDFIDNELWVICNRYAKQTIKIDISDEPTGFNLDQKIRYLQQNITNLEGFENLKTAFFHYLYPVLYAFKNSKKVNNSIHALIEKFKGVWEINRTYLSNKDFINELNFILNQLQSENFENSKVTDSEDTFSNKISIPEHDQINIPVSSETNLPDQQTEKIIFSGFPFREFSDKYLQDACLSYFVPRISVSCWPHEGELTFNYLQRRIESGYFLDKLPANTGFPNKLLLNSVSNSENEISNILRINKKVTGKVEDIIQAEKEFINLDNFQYEKYKSGEEDSDKFRYSVQCNIARFDDGCFLFLPNQSTVLSEFENESGKVSIRKLRFNQLSKGLRVFKFAQDQVNYAELLQGNQEIDKANSDLEIWRKTLSSLAEHFGSVQKLSKYLVSIADENNLKDANPDIINLRRWLNDEDMIAPNENNLRVIIDAGKSKDLIQDDIEKLIGQIGKAYKFINRTHISLGHQVKSAISAQLMKSQNLGSSFTVKVQYMEVEIVAKKILELQQSDIEVEYSNTRKFLC